VSRIHRPSTDHRSAIGLRGSESSDAPGWSEGLTEANVITTVYAHVECRAESRQVDPRIQRRPADPLGDHRGGHLRIGPSTTPGSAAPSHRRSNPLRPFIFQPSVRRRRCLDRILRYTSTRAIDLIGKPSAPGAAAESVPDPAPTPSVLSPVLARARRKDQGSKFGATRRSDLTLPSTHVTGLETD
jgi:hypothetical protein